MKKIFALLLCAVLIVLALPLASAAEPATIEGTLVAKVDHFGVKDGQRIPVVEPTFEGFLGTIVKVGAHPITVSELGRLAYNGNAQEHTLKLVNAANNEEVATTTVNMAGSTVDKFVYGTLATPVTLEANGTYYLLSSEKITGGDDRSDFCDVMYSGSAAVAAGYVMQSGAEYVTFTFANSGYVSLDMKFSYTPDLGVELDEDITEAFLDINYTIIRNDYHSFIGTKIITGNDELYVTELGRIFLDGNVQEHAVKLVDGETFEDVPGANVIIKGGTHEQITYAALETPVKLKANHPYLLMSREYINGDAWLEINTQYLPADDDDIMVMGGTYFITGYEDIIQLDCGFVGVNMKYTKVAKEEPPATEPPATDPPATQAPSQPGNAGNGNGAPAPEFPIWIPIVVVVVVAAAVMVVLVIKKKK